MPRNPDFSLYESLAGKQMLFEDHEFGAWNSLADSGGNVYFGIIQPTLAQVSTLTL